MTQQFVSEPIEPVAGTFDTAAMAGGAPGLPGQFIWRDAQYHVDEVLEVWKDSGPCRNGSAERYLRKHWYRIRANDGQIMTIYFDRQARSKRQAKARWWLYTIG